MKEETKKQFRFGDIHINITQEFTTFRNNILNNGSNIDNIKSWLDKNLISEYKNTVFEKARNNEIKSSTLIERNEWCSSDCEKKMTDEKKKECEKQEIEDTKEAWEFLSEVYLGKKEITLYDIKLIHSVFFKDLQKNKCCNIINTDNIGNFKTQSNTIMINDKEEFIPSDPLHVNEELEKVINIINNGEKYNKEKSTVEDLLKVIFNASMIHVLFERIHPFSDGNGRVGRALIQIYLSRVFDPIASFDLSSFFLENDKINYLGKLHSVETTKSFLTWNMYFFNIFCDEVEKQWRQILNEASKIKNIAPNNLKDF